MNYHICLIDDDPNSKSPIYPLLRQAHLYIVPFSSQEHWETRLDQADIDVILIHDQLATTTGAEVCRAIRAIDRFAIVPIMIFSYQDSEEQLLASYRAGAEDFISMTLPEEIVLEKIFSLIRIRTMYEKLKEVELLKDDFLSSVSHELRTPLAIIRENVSLVSDSVLGPVNARQQTQLEHALQGIDRLTTIVNDLLDISQIKAGKMHINRGNADFRDVLHEVYQTFLTTAKERAITLEEQCPSSLPAVYIDTKRIRQVLINLVGNAFKFTPNGGTITLTAELKDNLVLAAVRDTGPGIPPEHLSRVFARFFRTDSAVSQPGTGIGLAICKELVEAHGGDIWVDSSLGVGTTFYFTLPLKAQVIAQNSELLLHELRLAQKNQWSCAILRISLAAESRAPEESVNPEEIIETLMVEAKKIATRPQDYVFQYQNDRIFILLGRTDKSGGTFVRDRIQDAVSALLRLNRGWPELVYELYAFPDDEPDPEAFYQWVISAAS